jgi:magnesium chelatase subunit D
MALRHRLRQNVFEDGAATERIEQALDQITANASRKAKPLENAAGNGSTQSRSQNGNSATIEPAAPPAKAAIKMNLFKASTPKRLAFEKKSSGKKRRHMSQKAGRHVRSVNYETAAKRIAVAATIRAMLMLNQSTSDALRYKLFSRKQGALFIFLIDTSGSMARHRIALAKRAILDLLRQSYVNRDRVAIVTCRGESASVQLPPSRSILRARRAIDSLIVGGSTPLAAGLLATSKLIQCAGEKEGHKWVVVFTDGRPNVSLNPSPVAARDRDASIAEELKQLGAHLRKLGARVVVANTQRTFESTDEPKRLAQHLNAQFIPVSDV